jgi:hypothetical protein
MQKRYFGNKKNLQLRNIRKYIILSLRTYFAIRYNKFKSSERLRSVQFKKIKHYTLIVKKGKEEKTNVDNIKMLQF